MPEHMRRHVLQFRVLDHSAECFGEIDTVRRLCTVLFWHVGVYDKFARNALVLFENATEPGVQRYLAIPSALGPESALRLDKDCLLYTSRCV